MKSGKTYAIHLSNDEVDFLDTYIKDRYNTDEIETSTVIKSILLEQSLNLDFRKELKEIEKRAKALEVNSEFTLADLFTKEELDKKSGYKIILGKLFKIKTNDLDWVKEVRKTANGIRIYKKIK